MNTRPKRKHRSGALVGDVGAARRLPRHHLADGTCGELQLAPVEGQHPGVAVRQGLDVTRQAVGQAPEVEPAVGLAKVQRPGVPHDQESRRVAPDAEDRQVAVGRRGGQRGPAHQAAGEPGHQQAQYLAIALRLQSQAVLAGEARVVEDHPVVDQPPASSWMRMVVPVAAWEDDFTGYVVDYGTFPDQKRPYFTLRDARHTLAVATKASGLEGAIYAGLEKLTSDYLVREWRRDDGAMLRIERCLIDANWGSSTDVVYQFCRQSAHAGIVMPSHGRFVGASSQPFSEYKRKPGDRIGHNWRVPSVHGKRAVRHIVYDTNFWKTFVHARLAVPMGDRGCLSLFGDNPAQHRMFAEQLTAEYRVKTEGRGRTVDEWKLRPERGDNHWLDCLVGCATAASMQGVALLDTGGSAPPKRERVSFAELQRRRQR